MMGSPALISSPTTPFARPPPSRAPHARVPPLCVSAPAPFTRPPPSTLLARMPPSPHSPDHRRFHHQSLECRHHSSIRPPIRPSTAISIANRLNAATSRSSSPARPTARPSTAATPGPARPTKAVLGSARPSATSSGSARSTAASPNSTRPSITAAQPGVAVAQTLTRPGATRTAHTHHDAAWPTFTSAAHQVCPAAAVQLHRQRWGVP
jgi:hypothetical protein